MNISASHSIAYAGHGMTEHASQYTANAHVTAHERRHLQEFRNDARVDGREIALMRVMVGTNSGVPIKQPSESEKDIGSSGRQLQYQLVSATAGASLSIIA